MRRSILALLAVVFLVLPGCTRAQKTDAAERDQEATTSILWACRQDSAGRFRDVRVKGFQGVIQLEGRVDDSRALDDVLAIARSRARGCEIISKLEVRPR